MDWSKGYSASYYIAVVDPVTWRDIERLELKGGSIDREPDGLMHSADLDCNDFPTGEELFIRVYLDARQDGDGAHVALFTGLATTPEDEYNGNLRQNAVQCYSVLKEAEDILLPLGYYVAAGVDSGTAISRLLSVVRAPVEIAEDTPALTENIIADDSETNLSMAQKIVKAINWRMRITGEGVIMIEPMPTDAVATFDPLGNDCIESEITVTRDWFNIPNVFRAICDTLTAIARDDSEDSPFSTVSRGREIWAQDNSCELADNESIAEYADRRLKEEQQTAVTASYKRRFMPEIMPGDVIYLKYPRQGLNGMYRVSSQSIDLGYGATTSEEVTSDK